MGIHTNDVPMNGINEHMPSRLPHSSAGISTIRKMTIATRLCTSAVPRMPNSTARDTSLMRSRICSCTLSLNGLMSWTYFTNESPSRKPKNMTRSMMKKFTTIIQICLATPINARMIVLKPFCRMFASFPASSCSSVS